MAASAPLWARTPILTVVFWLPVKPGDVKKKKIRRGIAEKMDAIAKTRLALKFMAQPPNLEKWELTIDYLRYRFALSFLKSTAFH